jgi:pentatricopeptide repeat protein
LVSKRWLEFKWIKSPNHDTHLHRLFAYSYFGRWRECKETLEEMERRKCVFTHNSLAAAVRCAGLAQHLDEVLPDAKLLSPSFYFSWY